MIFTTIILIVFLYYMQKNAQKQHSNKNTHAFSLLLSLLLNMQEQIGFVYLSKKVKCFSIRQISLEITRLLSIKDFLPPLQTAKYKHHKQLHPTIVTVTG